MKSIYTRVLHFVNGARKGLADTTLRPAADSRISNKRGTCRYFSWSVIVTEDDCGAEGVEIKAFTDGKEVIEPLSQNYRQICY